jgi:radical SAM protein with 4Fe4S-binding SPASM domain
MLLDGIRYISIYLGDSCNFDCTYCDRGYIKNLGGQTLKHSDLPDVFKFFDWLWTQDTPDLLYIGLHGGEPFLFISRMEEIMEYLGPRIRERGQRVVITSNGSLILEHKEFIEKWQDVLNINWSYDFNYQDINRAPLPMKEIADFVRSTKTGLTFQFVVPAEGFNPTTAAEVINTCKLAQVKHINIIPLRHHRGAHKFKSFVEEMDLDRFVANFLPFLHTLYVNGLDVLIDGIIDGKIDKHLLDNHGKFILSPDGNLYPEFDFLEYKLPEYSVGRWLQDEPVIDRTPRDEDSLLLKKCRECPSKQLCGLKYFYAMFALEPGQKCVQFYQIIDITARHLNKLKTKPSLLHWINPYDET